MIMPDFGVFLIVFFYSSFCFLLFSCACSELTVLFVLSQLEHEEMMKQTEWMDQVPMQHVWC